MTLGTIVLLAHYFIGPISENIQYFIFVVGITFLGIPHGAADLLVALENESSVSFSKINFFAGYLFRLFLFAAILYFLPLFGIILFVVFSAYHFGETDLHQFKTNKLSGKLFVTSYGLVILSIILLNHFEEVKSLLLIFEAGERHIESINWVSKNRLLLMTIAGIVFFTSTFIYFLHHNEIDGKDKGHFLIRFALLCVLLFFMPLIIGFTFYFIVWHSVLSLSNIINYLMSHGKHTMSKILKQILLYSSIALLGMVLFCFSVFNSGNKNAVYLYIFVGLAVLTAPHMGVMHNMYNRIRAKT